MMSLQGTLSRIVTVWVEWILPARPCPGSHPYRKNPVGDRAMNVLRRLALSMMVGAVVGVPVVSQAQSCPAPPGMDVLLFVDNSGSIENDEFDAAQQAIAGIASDVLSRPGNRLAVVNWACDGGDANRDGCRLDLATGSAIA